MRARPPSRRLALCCREQMLEMDVAQDLKARLTKAMPDYVWQVFVGR